MGRRLRAASDALDRSLRKVSMLPWVVYVIVRIIRAGIVTYPVVLIDVRRVGVTRHVGIVAGWLRVRSAVKRRRALHWSRMRPRVWMLLGCHTDWHASQQRDHDWSK